jgi:MYXO-CTERM domain-containing protein
VAVNAFNYTWNATGGSTAPPILDLQNEMTGLIGGMIGLTDSNVVGSTMYPGISYGDTSKRSLAQDDIDGLVHLYPVASCPAPPAPGPNGCSAPPPDAGVPDGPAPGDAVVADSAAADLLLLDTIVDSVGDGPFDLSASDADGPAAPDLAVDGPAQDSTVADSATNDASVPHDSVAPVDAATQQDGAASPDAGPNDGAGWLDALPVAPVEDGCDCRVGSRSGSAGWLLLLMLALPLGRRRRR